MKYRCLGVILGLLYACAHHSVAESWTYTVHNGDTLWGLCQKYTFKSNCWQVIGLHNGVSYPKKLAPGTRIQFPVKWLKQQPQPVTVEYARGDVTAKVDEQNFIVTPGMQLNIGTTIRVKDNSALTLRFADGSFMRVDEDSTVRLDKLSAFGSAGMVDTRIFLQRGAVQTTVPKREPRIQFRVLTPSAVAAVRGTDFRVSYDGSSILKNAVYQGDVNVSNALGDQDVFGGYGILAQKDVAPPESVKLLTAPTFQRKGKLGSIDMPYILQWSSIRDAESYKVELLDPDRTDIALNVIAVEQSKLQLKDIPERCYLLRVSAIDQYGLQGMPAEQRLCLKQPPEEEKESPWGILTVIAIAIGIAL